MRRFIALVLGGLLPGCAGALAPGEQADTVWVGGVVYTVDERFSKASAMAVRGGRVLEVGSDEDALAWAGDRTQVIHLEGRCITPGLIDSHGHMAGLGTYALGRLDLASCKSFEGVVQRVRAVVAKTKAGEWIVGGRWDQASWGEKELPTHRRLSEVSPMNPVWLERVDGHAGLANARALSAAGLERGTTQDPAGGAILRDGSGLPTGMLIDNAMNLVERLVPGGGHSAVNVILAAQERCLSVGLTGVADAGLSPAEIEAYRLLDRDDRLKVRVYGMVHGSVGAGYLRTNKPQEGRRFSLRAVKLMMDGSLGSRGAWLLEPYADRATDEAGRPYTGLPVVTPDYVRHVTHAAAETGWQICTHAIGDRGVRETLNAYEAVLSDLPVQDHRYRIEHAQCIHLADIPRFARLGVIPSMQQTHATSDMRWAEARLGPQRIQGAYAWRRLAAAGSRIAAGSDFPVESENPLWGIYAGVTRQDHAGKPEGGWRPEERQSREEALRSFTIDAAYAMFAEGRRGSLERGRLADFVVWPVDIVTCPPPALLTASPVYVVIGGEIVRQPASR